MDNPPARSRRSYVIAPALAAVLAVAIPPALEGQAPLTEHTIRLDEGAASPLVRIEDFAFLAGRWRGTGLGGEVDELWSAPAAGTMVGAFRLIRNDSVVFYEIFAPEEHEGTVILRLKHFDPGPGLRGWEERDREVTFRLVRVEPDKALFSGLTFHTVELDTLMVYLAMRGRDGSVHEEVFHFSRDGA